MQPPTHQKVRVLYVVYWGALEPLGQALVVPSIERLSALGAQLTLVTFEKPADAADAGEMERVRGSLDSLGVRWLPLAYHRRPRTPATALDFAHGVARGIAERIRERPDVVHGRTFIGGLIARTVSRLTRRPFIYHNEGFYPDEQVDAGFWKEGSVQHRLARRLERGLYERADAVFSLSEAGSQVIECLEGVRTRGTPVIGVPSSVDLDRFSPPDGRPERTDGLRLVYVGSVGGRYLVDCIGRFVHVARKQRPGTQIHLQLLTPADPIQVRRTLAGSGLPDEAWSSEFVPHDALPARLALQDAGFSFHSHGLSAAGGSSTKVGEYWAMGLPLIATPGLGDVDEIVESEGVGVIVHSHTDDAYRVASDQLIAMLDEPDLAVRCRAAAERHYGLEEACERQIGVYEQLARGRSGGR